VVAHEFLLADELQREVLSLYRDLWGKVAVKQKVILQLGS
jgi:hypothetical protein